MIAPDAGPHLPSRRRVTPPRAVELGLEHCDTEGCGQPRGKGHPPRQWVRVHVTGISDTDLWFCCWRCVSLYAIGEELAGRDEPGERRSLPVEVTT